VQQAAVRNRKLADPAVLAEIAKSGKSTDVRVAAVERMTTEATLAAFARTDNAWQVRQAAVRNASLADQAVLTLIAKGDQDADVRVAAVGKLTDLAVLSEIAKADKQEQVREAVSKRMRALKTPRRK
jgi:hypothetical protein